MNESNNPSETRGWNTYWQGTHDTASYTSGGTTHPVITAFWNEALENILGRQSRPRILDLATGRGAVLEHLVQHADVTDAEITCVDISGAAIESVRQKYPTVLGIVADAAAVPLDSFGFDLVTSQFGIEYAGPKAMDEAARLLAPGGALALLMHIRPGPIFDECRAALDAVRRMQECEFIERASALFEAGFAAVRGADRAPYEQAASNLNPAIRELESIMSDSGEDVAGGKIARLYSDIERMHTRIQFYEPKEVIDWLRNMQREFSDYGSRMASMCDAAIDREAFAEIEKRLQDQGLSIVRGEPLLPADGEPPLAWALLADRKDEQR